MSVSRDRLTYRRIGLLSSIRGNSVRGSLSVNGRRNDVRGGDSTAMGAGVIASLSTGRSRGGGVRAGSGDAAITSGRTRDFNHCACMAILSGRPVKRRDGYRGHVCAEREFTVADLLGGGDASRLCTEPDANAGNAMSVSSQLPGIGQEYSFCWPKDESSRWAVAPTLR